MPNLARVQSGSHSPKYYLLVNVTCLRFMRRVYVLAANERDDCFGDPISVVLMPKPPPPLGIWGCDFLCLLAKQETMLSHVLRRITCCEGSVRVVATNHDHLGHATNCIARRPAFPSSNVWKSTGFRVYLKMSAPEGLVDDQSTHKLPLE